jgi:hypothetical protein
MDENGCSWINSISDIGDDVGYDVNDDVRDVIHNVTSPFNNEFHEDWFWVCLDIFNEMFSCCPWHLIIVLDT